MKPPRREEQFACEVLRRALGAVITDVDDNPGVSKVDALFELPDGRTGALEVTTLADKRTLEVESLAARRWHVDGARWAWDVRVSPKTSMNGLREHLPALLLACEAQGVREPDIAEIPPGDEAAFRWYRHSKVSIMGFPETNRPGAIDVLTHGGGGAVFDHLDDLPAWLEEALATPALAAKLAKLEATGRAERHLFLRVHDSGMPFKLYDPLAFTTAVPTAPLTPPAGLTGLWLVPQWSIPVLGWTADAGWQRHDVLS